LGAEGSSGLGHGGLVMGRRVSRCRAACTIEAAWHPFRRYFVGCALATISKMVVRCWLTSIQRLRLLDWRSPAEIRKRRMRQSGQCMFA
jgi:hypothetical protein